MMTLLQLQVLGPFAVKVQGTPVSNFRSDKIRALLIYLAVESDRPHRRKYLASLLWPDMARAASLSNLRKSLSRLRQTLGKAPSEQLLIATRQTIAIRPSEIDVDVLAFARTVSQTAQHRHTAVADCAQCMARLEKALNQYSGEFLSGFTLDGAFEFSDWVTLQREKWRQRYLVTLQTLTAAYIEREKWERALLHGQQQVAAAPWREIAHRQLMQIYAGLGQINAVRRQYETCRQQLLDELGVPPSPHTKSLYESLVQTAAPLVPPASPPSLVKRRLNLPRQFTSFVGRETVLQEINGRLDTQSCALLTLLGPGGVGKTRISIEIARRRAERYRDGVIFVSLAPVADVADIPRQIVEAVDLPHTGKEEIQSLLLRYLRQKELLLVLDNFEHLLAGASLVMEILHEAPGVQILITSRSALNLRAEWLYDLPGLRIPAPKEREDFASYSAVQLFRQRLSQMHTSALTDADMEAAIRICHLVEGNPLAIELAASQARSSSVTAVAEALARSLDTLQTEMVDVPPRHRSLRAIFDYSWAALSSAQQSLLMQLSVFSGGFSPAAAAAVAGATVEQLALLQDKSFLSQAALKRYGMHEVLRQYAREKLAAAGLEERGLLQHSQYYLDYLSRLERAMVGREGKTILATLQSDLANILQAWRSACLAGATGILQQSHSAMSRLLYLRNLLAQGEKSFAGAVTAVTPLLPANTKKSAAHRLLVQLLNGQARFLLDLGRFKAANKTAKEALALAEAGGFRQQKALALMQIGSIHTVRSEYEHAHQMHDEAANILEALARKSDVDPWQIRNLQSANYKQKCDAYWEAGDLDRAMACMQTALALDIKNGDVRGEASCFHREGIIARIQGDYDRAIIAFEKSIALAQMAGASRLQHWLKNSLALSYSNRGDNQLAKKLFEEFYQTAQEWGALTTQLTALVNLGLVAARQGVYLEAKSYYEQGLMLAIQSADTRAEGILLGNLGVIAMRLGAFEEASQLFADSLEARLMIDARTGELYSRYYIARLAIYEGDYATAVSQSQRVLDLADESSIEDIVNLARTSLGHAYAMLEQPDRAKPLYQEAIAGWQKTGQNHLLLGPKSGLARIALQEDDLDRALMLCDEILEQAPDLDLESTFEPFDIWLVCINVLRAAGDDRVESTLRAAYHRLQKRAANIPDADTKSQFLGTIAAHREIVSLARETLGEAE